MNSWHSAEPEPFEGEIASVEMTRITIVTRPLKEVDKRYRIQVLLQRSDRPKYWIFSCPHCKYDVCELTDVDVEAMSDLVSIPGENVMVGIRCPGPYCKYYYYFKLSGISA